MDLPALLLPVGREKSRSHGQSSGVRPSSSHVQARACGISRPRDSSSCQKHGLASNRGDSAQDPRCIVSLVVASGKLVHRRVHTARSPEMSPAESGPHYQAGGATPTSSQRPPNWSFLVTATERLLGMFGEDATSKHDDDRFQGCAAFKSPDMSEQGNMCCSFSRAVSHQSNLVPSIQRYLCCEATVAHLSCIRR